MTRLYPARARSFIVEIKATASPGPAIMRADALKGRLRTPGKRALVIGKPRPALENLINRTCRLCIVGFHLATDVQLAAQWWGGQERGAQMMRSKG